VDSVVRALTVYLVLLLIFRIAGSRTLAEITTFDFVLVLIISEAVQQAMIDDDNSMTNGFLIVVTLVGVNVLLSLAKQRWPRLERLLDGTALVLIDRGRMHRERMERERVDESDVLEAARELQGVSTLDDVDYAVLEKNGHVTIVPRKSR
jgi:uncharacterized membrane protein YcaP (DUF421 family)